ncbi:MAG TPA: hypothetical protein P5191_10200 [Ruminococcus sp.]|nr:hypothetical protein [Ruminococcus sp.]
MEYYEDENVIEERKKGKKLLKTILITVIVLFALSLMIYKIFIPVEYWYFSSKRIQKIENEYKISLDDTEPIRYWKPLLAQDTISRFDFFTDDYEEVMESFHGEDITTIRKYKDSGNIEYECHVEDDHYFKVIFKKSDGRYKGELTYYRDDMRSHPAEQTETTSSSAKHKVSSGGRR